MRICLLICRAPFLVDERVFPPLGLLTVGTALKQQGHDVVIRDFPDEEYRHFGMGPTTPEYGHALAMLRYIKSIDKSDHVVIGGPHAEANVDQCLEDGFDTVAVGDGELASAGTFVTHGVDNLGTRPLDEYPIADRGLVDIRSYRYHINSRAATTMMTSRGCPYRCSFCSKTNKYVRYYSPERVEQEIVYLRERWGFTALMLYDDTFILDKDRAAHICEALARREMIWRCFVRGDLVVRHGKQFVEMMAETGCKEVGMGIESGSHKILSIIRKGETIDDIRQGIAMLRAAGIRVKGFFIVGLPGEDNDSLAETRSFLDTVELDDADFTVFQPYQGSHIWNHPEKYDVTWKTLPADDRFYKGRNGEYQCAVRTSELSESEILAARDDLVKAFSKSG